MHPVLGAFALSAALLLGACAATPGEELGSIPPRSPVTPPEQAKVYPIDVWDPFKASTVASTGSTRTSTVGSSCR
jgi:hypothetical protein